MTPEAPADHWVEQVYAATGKDDLVRLYDRWAETYDADMQGIGYIHPAVVAGLAGRYVRDKTAPIVDAGAGTGSVGQLLAILGYSNLIGLDISDGMLERARARGVYADLRNRLLGEPLDFADAAVAAVVSTGVFTTGHAPAAAFDELTRITRKGGHLIFTVGTGVWRDNGFARKLSDLIGQGLLAEIEVTPVYHPMPHSPAEAHFTTTARVYRRI